MERFKAGETLITEDTAYLERVKQAIRDLATGGKSGTMPMKPRGPIIPNTADWSALVRITEVTAPYKGEDGGLYGGGSNKPERRD